MIHESSDHTACRGGVSKWDPQDRERAYLKSEETG